MSFIRGAWKIVVAVKDGLVLLFLLAFFALLYAALSMQPDTGDVVEGALLLELDGVIVEEVSPSDPFSQLLSGSSAVREYAARDLVHIIDTARNDGEVTALVLDLDFFLGGGQVSLGDVGAAIERFKQSKKPVYAYATFYGNDAYRLAAHADEIWVDPMGGIALAGPGGSRLYYKQLLDKLGVTAHIYRVGTYKSAVEPFMLDGPSPEAADAQRELYSELWADWLAAVRKARPQAMLTDYIERPADLVEQAQGDLAQLALDRRLATKVGDRSAFTAHLVEKLGKADEEPMMYAASLDHDYLAARSRPEDGEAIGVLTVSGEIVDGEASPGLAASGAITDLVYQGLADESFKALVVRIDSPGGSALASEEIRLALKAVREKGIPVIVSMGDVAASGGYWIATEADTIFAEPDTITGSIGVFAVLPSFEKLLADWGVGTGGTVTTPLSGQPDLVGGVNEEFGRIAQAGVEHSYRQFLTLVGNARDMPVERVDAIGQGRVWDGGTAHQLGLVDRLGGFRAALVEAAKQAGLKDYHAVYLHAPPTFAEWLFSDDSAMLRQQARTFAGRGLVAWAAREQRRVASEVMATLNRLTAGGDVQALCLECGGSRPTSTRHPDGFRALLYAMLKD